MRSFSLVATLLSVLAAASAKTVVITVGGNTTDDPTTVFQPAEVTANIGDTVLFNFTLGNHTAIQSVFVQPCVPAHDSDVSINGFISGFRDAGNGTAITNLPVSITDNNTIWFYDANLCGQGGVGVINVNDTTGQTLEGFRNNAIRFNGTNATATSTSVSATGTSPSGTQSGSAATTSTTGGTSGADRVLAAGFVAAVPMVAAALLL